MKDKIVAFRSTERTAVRQALPVVRGINRASAGAEKISMNLVIIPPGGKATPHRHKGCETAIYILKGRVETRYGPGLKFSESHEAGDFIYIPADLAHQPVNLSATEEAHALVAHSAGDEQESVELYDPASER